MIYKDTKIGIKSLLRRRSTIGDQPKFILAHNDIAEKAKVAKASLSKIKKKRELSELDQKLINLIQVSKAPEESGEITEKPEVEKIKCRSLDSLEEINPEAVIDDKSIKISVLCAGATVLNHNFYKEN